MKIVVFNLWGNSINERKVFRNTAAIMSALMSGPDRRGQVVKALNAVDLESSVVPGQVEDITFVVYNNPNSDDFVCGITDHNDADYIHVSGHGKDWPTVDRRKQAGIKFSNGLINVRNVLAPSFKNIQLKASCKVFFEVCGGFNVALCLMQLGAGAMVQLWANGGTSVARIGSQAANTYSMGFPAIGIKGFPGGLCDYDKRPDDFSREFGEGLLTVLHMLGVPAGEQTGVQDVLDFCTETLE